MIFPILQKQIKKDGRYILKEKYEKGCLFDFYNGVKDGSSDIGFICNPLLKKEEYRLCISEDGVEITFSTDEGKYRAVTTLYQMLSDNCRELEFTDAEDYPEIGRRGYMLDISRCRMPRVKTIKSIIDYLSLLKYNEFQLYMEGECFKYSEFPEYTKDFDCLSADDIEELDRYCEERFMDFVPNQNCFGHMGKWLRHREFRHLALCEEGKTSSTLNPLKPETLEFVGRIFDSVLPHFKSDYVNIGLDEACGLGEYQSEEYCREHGKDTLFMDYLGKVSGLIKEKYNKKIMFWDDMIIGKTTQFDRIPKDAVALEWGYELIQSQLMAEHCITLKNNGVKFYVCPSCNTHLSFTGRFDVTSFNIRTAAEVGKKYGADGLLLTDWGCDDGHPHFGVWSMIPCALAGQFAWNVGAEQDGETFKADFIRAAIEFTDNVFFEGKGVAQLMCKLSNYYLYEPERVHLGSLCGEMFKLPLNKTKFVHICNLKDIADPFYFNNVIRYIKEIIPEVEEKDFDSRFKREILVNAKSVILSAELIKVRIDKKITDEKKRELFCLFDEIESEYRELWTYRNFEKGMDDFINQLKNRKEELTAI